MRLKNIFQTRDLTFLWVGQVVSVSGDSIYQIGLLWLALELSNSEAVTGLVATSAYLPSVLLALFAGVIADRADRRRIMLSADIFRMLVVLLVPVAFFFKVLNPTLLAVNAFTVSIGFTFFNPSRDSIIPQLVPAEGLLRANSLIQSSWHFALLIGPALAGLLLELVGKIHLFTSVSAAYFISFLFVLMIKPAARKVETPRKGFGWGEVKEGLAFALRHKVILPLLLLTVADNILIMGPAIVGAPVFVREVLGMGAGAYATTQISYAVGMLIGTAALMALGDRFKKGRILLTGMVMDGFTFIPLYFVKSLPLLWLAIVVHSFAIPLLMVPRASLIQKLVPPEMTGRVFAMINMAVVGMSAVSSGLAGFALQAYGAPNVFLVIGIGGGLCGIAGWIFARELRETA